MFCIFLGLAQIDNVEVALLLFFVRPIDAYDAVSFLGRFAHARINIFVPILHFREYVFASWLESECK